MRKAVEELETLTTKLPFNLQLFAEDVAGNNGEGETDPEEKDPDDGEKEPEKQFTQEEVNAIGAKEKKQGRKAAFKELGFSSETEAKKELEAYKKWKEEQLTDEEKQEKANKENDARMNELLERANKAEQRLAALSAGVRVDSVEDAVAIASMKVTEEKELSDILEEMKKESRYAGFFNSDTEDADKGGKGTGSSLKHTKKESVEENIGKRLGKAQAQAKVTKSKYFSK